MSYDRGESEQQRDRAVSPVIGVILMVAITVILAAVIGTFVLDLGQNTENSQPPQVNFEYEYNESSNNLTITVKNGEEFNDANIDIFSDDGVTVTEDQWNSDGKTVRAADQIVVQNVEEDEEVKIMWMTNEGGDGSHLIGGYTP